MAARGGLLHPPGSPRVSSVLGQGIGPAQVLGLTCQDQRNRRADSGQDPLHRPQALIPLELAEGPAASLRRRVRVTDRLRSQWTRHKTRIRELARQMMPSIDDAVTSELRMADMVVLERYVDPKAGQRGTKDRSRTGSCLLRPDGRARRVLNKVVCVVAAHLAGRAWVTLRRGEPYVLRDIDGTEFTVAEGKEIVARALRGPRRGASSTSHTKSGVGPSHGADRILRSRRPSPATKLQPSTRQGQGACQLAADGRAINVLKPS